MPQPLISVCIPTYEMRGLGADFLRHSFSILATQTFRDFDVVISDHATDGSIKAVCDEFSDRLHIKYTQNTEHVGNSSANLNAAIRQATGKLVKILFQDDYLLNEHALESIATAFDLEHDHWLVTGSEHTSDGKTLVRPHVPLLTKNPHFGDNRIGSPSVLTIKNEQPFLFDERLIWLMDGDYYKRMTVKYGPPKILADINVVNRLGEHQITQTTATQERRDAELAYVQRKFRREVKKPLQLPRVTLVAVSSVKIQATINALRLSADRIAFYDVVLISDTKPKNLPPDITFKQCPPLRTIDAYSKFIAYDLASYIDSDFALVVQYDGFVVRPERWQPEFLKYDYIGAPWPPDRHFTKEKVNVRVGNGGFSLRSAKLLRSLNELHLQFIDGETGYFNEDGVICSYYRRELEDAGMHFTPPSVAAKFSKEDDCPDSDPTPFGYHKNVRVVPFSLFIRHPVLSFGVLRIRWIIFTMEHLPSPRKVLTHVLHRFRLLMKGSQGSPTLTKQQIKKMINKPNPIIFEIGAADGLDTEEILKTFTDPELQLYCFEPDPRNIEAFKKRIHDPRVKLFPIAIGEKDGTMTLQQSSTVYSSSLKQPNLSTLQAQWPSISFDKTVEVEVSSLDSFLAKQQISTVDFIWADVQGAEDMLLRGATNSLHTAVRYLYTEYSNVAYYKDEPTLDDILRLVGPDWKVLRDFGSDVLLKNTRL